MKTLYDKEVKVENPTVDWNNSEDRARYIKTGKQKKTQLCPLSNKDYICTPSLTTPRNSKGETHPFYCISDWYISCSIFKKTYGGLLSDHKD